MICSFLSPYKSVLLYTFNAKKRFDIMDTYDMILMFRLRFNARNNRNSTCKCDANLAYSYSTYKQKNRLLQHFIHVKQNQNRSEKTN